MLKVIIHFWKYLVVNITALVWATVKVSHKDWMLKLINRLVHKFEILRLAAKRRWSMCMNSLSTCMNYQQCAWTINNVHELSTMCMNYQQCAWTINNMHELSTMCMNCQQCAWTINNMHELSTMCHIQMVIGLGIVLY